MKKTVRKLATICWMLLLLLTLPLVAQAKGNRILWSGDVDGTIELQFHKRHVKVHKISGKNLEHAQVFFRSALPDRPIVIEVHKKTGRGKVEIFQQPAASNKYTLGVRISDDAGGRAHYSIVLVW